MTPFSTSFRVDDSIILVSRMIRFTDVVISASVRHSSSLGTSFFGDVDCYYFLVDPTLFHPTSDLLSVTDLRPVLLEPSSATLEPRVCLSKICLSWSVLPRPLLLLIRFVVVCLEFE